MILKLLNDSNWHSSTSFVTVFYKLKKLVNINVTLDSKMMQPREVNLKNSQNNLKKYVHAKYTIWLMRNMTIIYQIWKIKFWNCFFMIVK